MVSSKNAVLLKSLPWTEIVGSSVGVCEWRKHRETETERQGKRRREMKTLGLAWKLNSPRLPRE